MITILKQSKISAHQFNELLSTCKLIRNNKYNQPKVGLFEEKKEIIKFFWLDRKSFFRRNIYTVSRQLVCNAEKIHRLGFVTTLPKAWYRCDEKQVEVVIYDFLPGITIYETIAAAHSCEILKPFAAYVAKVHAANIYFRAGHLDNYLQDDGHFSIIDVDNARFSLSIRQRAKNLSYMYTHATENKLDFFETYDFNRFIDEYLDAARLSPRHQKTLRKHLNNYLTNP
jgi:tRNA A-37 threonylcarbamoyl transferase component Bud32